LIILHTRAQNVPPAAFGDFEHCIVAADPMESQKAQNRASRPVQHIARAVGGYQFIGDQSRDPTRILNQAGFVEQVGDTDDAIDDGAHARSSADANLRREPVAAVSGWKVASGAHARKPKTPFYRLNASPKIIPGSW
jgi:hypothetical protein